MKTSVLTVAILAGVSLATLATAAVVHATSRSLPTSPTYVALGDSIAAGAGLPLAPGAGNEDSLCARSAESYPNLLASKLGTGVTNLACSGAKDSDGIIGAQTSNDATIPSQLDRAFENGTPDLLTITIGANDIRWVQFISKCYVDTCGTLKDTGAAATFLTTFQGKLAYTLREIKKLSGTHTPPKVLLTGYYYPVSSTSCLGGQVTNNELRWINAQTDNLNKAIRQTVAATTKISSWFKGTYNFATYVPITFNGHGLCSNDSWVQGLNDPAPLHPTAAGEAAIASQLSAQIK